ncbi:MAG: (2Fe-2S)-binding protein [Candidatus Aminicenantales bacterium]
MQNKKQRKKKALTRRDFLKGFGGGALSTAVAPKLISPRKEIPLAGEAALSAYSKKRITFRINGRPCSLEVEAGDTLLYVLREKLNLTGTKRICNRGQCGGCTVLVDGMPVYSCLYLAVRAEGKNLTTIEGLATNGKLHPVQKTFIEHDGYQCGFCTPGFIMSSVGLLKKNSNPTLEQIKQGLAGNLCRCGNYTKIYKAVQAASKEIRRSQNGR